MLESLTRGMARQGPDGTNHWRQNSVALGHCMLRTTPESKGEVQPLLSEGGRFVVVMDGRLDNRNDLRRELQLKGFSIRSNTDAELVLRSFQAWGNDSPKHLLGDFAYAVWDNEHHRLFCARDHLGARPFAYAKTASYLAFASIDDALPSLPGLSWRPNEERIADLLAPGIQTVNPPRSWLRDIWSLWPGESMTTRADGSSNTATYWEPEIGEEDFYGSDGECQEAFVAIFREAVSCRLRSVAPPAAMMSGGLDSAGISVMVHRLLPNQASTFHTYSAISDAMEPCVETQCIQNLTSRVNVRPRYLYVPSIRGALGMEELIDTAWSEAHPIDTSILIPAMMCRAAAKSGDRVLLHGVSGDLTMDAPDRYPAYLLQSGQYWRAWQECRASSRNHTYLKGISPYELMLRNAWTSFAPARLKSAVRGWRRRGNGVFHEGCLIREGFAKRVGLTDLAEIQRDQSMSLAHLRQASARIVFRDPGLVSGLSGYGRVAGRFGVELRDPWADRRVVEFFLRLPLRFKIRNGWTKYLARTAFEPDLSPLVCWRRNKEHLGWQLICRLMDETHHFILGTLSDGLECLSEYVDSDALHRTIDKYKSCKDDASRASLFQLTTLALWLKQGGRG